LESSPPRQEEQISEFGTKIPGGIEKILEKALTECSKLESEHYFIQ
jgi:hypothetical protein